MTSRASRYRAFPIFVAFLMNLVIGPLAPAAQVAPVTAVTGSSANATDGLNISNLADNGTIDAGELAAYTIVVWSAGPGTALNASWSDDLPAGVNWSVELINPDMDDACASSIESGSNQSASCDFGDLPPSSMQDGKTIVISGLTDGQDCGELDHTAFAHADNTDSVHASASISVKCPTIAIDSIQVTSGSEQGGAPSRSVPNTALVLGRSGEPVSIPVELMVLLFLGSFGTLVVANVSAVRRRR